MKKQKGRLVHKITYHKHYVSLNCEIILNAVLNHFFRLNFGLITVTMFVSMWISNTAAVAMMCPIMQAVLEELQSVRFIYKI